MAGTSILALFEFDLRLHQLGVDAVTRDIELKRYRALLSEIVNVDEVIRSEGVRSRINATARASAIDTLIAATASVRSATLVHRDPHGNSGAHSERRNTASEIIDSIPNLFRDLTGIGLMSGAGSLA
ncbi:MAG TPA: hypothetical protein VH595_19960 [Verrucomicrobiae bacterium]|nr:hypothetical protein [Verrucomicrobiae bacterium]